MTIQEIVELFEQLELHLINSLKRNLMRHRKQEQDEGGKDGVPKNWEAWQSAKLRDVRRFRRENEKILGEYMPTIEEETEKLLRDQYAEGGADSFFESSNPKLESLIHEMQNNEARVEQGCLRYMSDVYRKTILRTATAMNAGGMSMHEAVDEATKDFLAQGINCIQYANGRLVNIASYAEMALRTCNTRAMLMGEAKKREQMGVCTSMMCSRPITVHGPAVSVSAGTASSICFFQWPSKLACSIPTAATRSPHGSRTSLRCLSLWM